MTLIIKTTGWEDYLGDEGAYIKALIMGPPGAGKTRSASFWPKPIFADCEKGRMSIADRGVAYGEVRSGQQMDDLMDLLQRECRKGKDRKYQTLVIDTVDSYQRIVIQERLLSEKKEALQGWADWGHLDGKMTQFLERMLNLPMNIVVNMHVKETTEDVSGSDSKLIVMQPKLKGDLRDQIAAEFDLVGYMGTYWQAVDGKRTLKRAIRWTPEPRYPILKDRSGKLPSTTEVNFTDEDFLGLYQKIVGDHIDAMPATHVLEEVGDEMIPTAAPVGPDERGGPVAEVKDFPRSKADKKQKTPPSEQTAIEVTETDATPAPVPATPDVVAEETDVPTTTPVVEETPPELDATDGDKEVNKEVNKEAEPVDKSGKEAVLCGSQPARLVGKSDPAPGCSTPMPMDNEEDKNRGNISLLRTNTYLCEKCFQMWKDAN
jgi:hypothetical protein